MSFLSWESMKYSITNWVTEHGLRILLAIIIIIIGRWIARFLVNNMKNVCIKKQMDAIVVTFLGNVIYALFLTIVLIAALAQVGVQTTSVIAILGAASLAVGLALHGSLSNFAAGVMIVTFRPFKVGDYIEAGGTAGIVEEMSVFTTFLRSPDNRSIIVPNSAVLGGNIINYSAKPTRRMDLVFSVAYSSDVKKVKEVIKGVLDADSRILQDPAPTIGIVEFADSSINFAVRRLT